MAGCSPVDVNSRCCDGEQVEVPVACQGKGLGEAQMTRDEARVGASSDDQLKEKSQNGASRQAMDAEDSKTGPSRTKRQSLKDLQICARDRRPQMVQD
ncbi:hypothetical protein ANO11243_046780 [Dothideomycetidae sp. 11243]|nr:hypothetical protein ANO11243_046780 [fungal sp. No.11243]